MGRGTWRMGRRTKWILATLALLCGGVLLLNVVVVRWARTERAALDSAFKDSFAAVDQRKAEQQAALERAKAALPPDAGISSDWSYDACVKQLEDGNLGPILLDSEGVAMAILRGADLPPGTEGSAPPDSKARSMLADIQGRIARTREAGRLPQICDGLDLARHDREDVLRHVEAFIAGLPPLREAAEAYQRGVFVTGRLDHTEDASLLYRTLPDALAYRAVLEAYRGDIEAAVCSCFTACGMYHCLVEAQGDLGGAAPSWYVRLLADAAWRTTPLTQEQRERVVSGFVFRITPERFTEALVSEGALSHQLLQEFIDESRHHRLSILPSAPWDSMVEAYFSAEIDSCVRTLHRLLEQVSSPTWTALDSGSVKLLQVSGRWEPFARVLASHMAREYVEVARNNCMPDVVRTFFALKDYQRAHGEYPKTLDGLCPDPIPALPDDPVNGGPMIYKSDGKAFTISSRPMPLPPDASDFVEEHVKWVNENVLMWKASE